MNSELYSDLMVISGIIFFITLIVGYVICYFIITPILLVKHKGRSFIEAAFWEGIQAENHLKDIAVEKNDRVAVQALKIINASKYIIIISLILFIVFAVMS